MPVWHEALREARRQNRVALLGVIQEQHAQRCQLFAQWQQFDWPIVHDPINQLQLRGVPVSVAIDEYGIIRAINPDRDEFVSEFLSQSFAPPSEAARAPAATKRSIAQLRIAARSASSYAAWKELGDALILWGPANSSDEAVQTYRQASREKPDQAEIHFRLGVAHRMRYEAPLHGPGATVTALDGIKDERRPARGSTDRPQDFQAAVDHWTRALQLDPNHYIYRRRIEQYGPRLSKPYPFYDWVSQARAEILARGEVPISLPIEPRGTELAGPATKIPSADRDPPPPDPQGRIQRDENQAIRFTSTVVPAQVSPGQAVRVHLQFEPTGRACWNNEADPLVVWVDVPHGWTAETQLLRSELPHMKSAESTESRVLELDLQSAQSPAESVILRAYALYHVCETQGDVCRYLRQDINIPIRLATE